MEVGKIVQLENSLKRDSNTALNVKTNKKDDFTFLEIIRSKLENASINTHSQLITNYGDLTYLVLDASEFAHWNRLDWSLFRNHTSRGARENGEIRFQASLINATS